MKIALLRAAIRGLRGLEILTFVEPLGLICVAGGSVTMGAVRDGMNVAKVFNRPETFLAAHRVTGAA